MCCRDTATIVMDCAILQQLCNVLLCNVLLGMGPQQQLTWALCGRRPRHRRGHQSRPTLPRYPCCHALSTAGKAEARIKHDLGNPGMTLCLAPCPLHAASLQRNPCLPGDVCCRLVLVPCMMLQVPHGRGEPLCKSVKFLPITFGGCDFDWQQILWPNSTRRGAWT